MNTHEFLKASIDKELQKLGYPAGICSIAADDAVEFYKRTANFKKGGLVDCITYAKKRAKEHSKMLNARKGGAA